MQQRVLSANCCENTFNVFCWTWLYFVEPGCILLNLVVFASKQFLPDVAKMLSFGWKIGLPPLQAKTLRRIRGLNILPCFLVSEGEFFASPTSLAKNWTPKHTLRISIAVGALQNWFHIYLSIYLNSYRVSLKKGTFLLFALILVLKVGFYFFICVLESEFWALLN